VTQTQGRNNIKAGAKMPEKPLQVILRGLNVDALNNCSGVFIGRNFTSDWESISKANNGFGPVDGCRVKNSIHIVSDQDLIDSPVSNHFKYSGDRNGTK
jgi:hypothetical protein